MKVCIEFNMDGSEFKSNYTSAIKRVMSRAEFILKYDKKEQFIAVMRTRPEELKSTLRDKLGNVIGSVRVENNS
jgi:hypothetical protein